MPILREEFELEDARGIELLLLELFVEDAGEVVIAAILEFEFEELVG